MKNFLFGFWYNRARSNPRGTRLSYPTFLLKNGCLCAQKAGVSCYTCVKSWKLAYSKTPMQSVTASLEAKIFSKIQNCSLRTIFWKENSILQQQNHFLEQNIQSGHWIVCSRTWFWCCSMLFSFQNVVRREQFWILENILASSEAVTLALVF